MGGLFQYVHTTALEREEVYNELAVADEVSERIDFSDIINLKNKIKSAFGEVAKKLIECDKLAGYHKHFGKCTKQCEAWEGFGKCMRSEIFGHIGKTIVRAFIKLAKDLVEKREEARK